MDLLDVIDELFGDGGKKKKKPSRREMNHKPNRDLKKILREAMGIEVEELCKYYKMKERSNQETRELTEYLFNYNAEWADSISIAAKFMELVEGGLLVAESGNDKSTMSCMENKAVLYMRVKKIGTEKLQNISSEYKRSTELLNAKEDIKKLSSVYDVYRGVPYFSIVVETKCFGKFEIVSGRTHCTAKIALPQYNSEMTEKAILQNKEALTSYCDWLSKLTSNRRGIHVNTVFVEPAPIPMVLTEFGKKCAMYDEFLELFDRTADSAAFGLDDRCDCYRNTFKTACCLAVENLGYEEVYKALAQCKEKDWKDISSMFSIKLTEGDGETYFDDGVYSGYRFYGVVHAKFMDYEFVNEYDTEYSESRL